MNLFKNFSLFVIMGLLYVCIEILYRGYSHYSMFILGGICGVVIGLINEIIPWEMSLIKQALIGCGIITSLEFITGVIVNIVLNMHVWDYSNVPFNILGQICLPFSILWFFISFVVIMFDDCLRYYLFDEDKPKYYLFSNK